jgi:hypothetical protein
VTLITNDNCLIQQQIDFLDHSYHQSILEISAFQAQLRFDTREKGARL